jgi:Bacterial PH domain
MRLNTDRGGVPAGVDRYLLPAERQVITVRQHPAVLSLPLGAALGGLLAAIAVSQIPHVAKSARLAVWILTVFLITRLIQASLNWMVYYVVLTKDRLLVLSGFFNRTVVVIRITDLENMTYERSSTGRISGHGSLTIGPGGAPQTVIDYVPYPEQLYLEIRGLIGQRGKED